MIENKALRLAIFRHERDAFLDRFRRATKTLDLAANPEFAAGEWTEAEQSLENLRPSAADQSSQPMNLPVHQRKVDAAQAVVCINMIHISPWSASEALFTGASRRLVEGGVLYLYGPYKRGGAHTGTRGGSSRCRPSAGAVRPAGTAGSTTGSTGGSRP